MRFVYRLAIIALLIPLRLFAQGGQVVGTGGTSQLGNPTGWIPSVTPDATIGVTTNAPRVGYAGYGSGSLEMSVTGTRDPASGQYPDWGFWYRYASGDYINTINNNASFGNLQELSALSFDWYRVSVNGWDAPVGEVDDDPAKPIPPADWAYKTPVLRLQLREHRDGFDDVISELVWEGYYNQCSLGADPTCANNITPVDQWVTQTGMQNDNFWYVRPPVVGGSASYSSGGACGNQMSFWAGGVNSQNQTNLFSGATLAPDGSVITPAGCLFGANVEIIGVAVGVGSQWPLPYHGYVDNVRLGFTGQDGLALDANFDVIATPEPSTYALMAFGLVGLGFAAQRRRNKA